MRLILLAVTFVLGISAAAAGQSPLRVVVTGGEFRAGMSVVTTPYATGGPWAAVRATPVKTGVESTVAEFRIRAWVEGEGARVLVFAVFRSGPGRAAPGDERETQIASVLVPAGRTIEIAATEKYRARRITVTAERPEMRRYDAEKVIHGIDIPLRPWTPPRRPQ